MAIGLPFHDPSWSPADAVPEATPTAAGAEARAGSLDLALVRAVIEEPDPRRQIALYAATQPGIHRRSGPVLRALRDGMASDPDLRPVWDEMEAWRLDGQGRFVAMLADKGAIRRDLSIDAARDIVWTLCSLAVHDLLVVDRGWTSERYQEWLTNALICVRSGVFVCGT